MSRKDVKLSGCGELCILCSNYLGYKESKCGGCNLTKGNPFWGECKTYACIEEKEVDHW
ncbi:hypothetical protein GF319_06065 [Candidatus Bathyarchaeota archaeon]|nr:hypothetical protein [Candidatus Bathyarchaeota archaeon]